MTRSVALLGASGLVGSAIAAAMRGNVDVEIRTVASPRLSARLPRDLNARALIDMLGASSTQRADLATRLTGVDVVIVASGLALPDSVDEAELCRANALMPLVVAAAASDAGVGRLVHISSAAVQGNVRVLDESPFVAPLTPYGRSKAKGELVLADWADGHDLEVVLYRPTSVVSLERPVSMTLLRLVSSRIVPIVGDGLAPQPLCLLQNVGRAVSVLVDAPEVPRVVVHPSEGMSVAALVALVERRSIRLRLPKTIATWAVAGLRRARSEGLARRVELYAFGQQTASSSLPALGYEPVGGLAEYRGLVRAARGGS